MTINKASVNYKRDFDISVVNGYSKKSGATWRLNDDNLMEDEVELEIAGSKTEVISWLTLFYDGNLDLAIEEFNYQQ
jgi:hypothetical protein